jgi:hypothetical protein
MTAWCQEQTLPECPLGVRLRQRLPDQSQVCCTCYALLRVRALLFDALRGRNYL